MKFDCEVVYDNQSFFLEHNSEGYFLVNKGAGLPKRFRVELKFRKEGTLDYEGKGDKLIKYVKFLKFKASDLILGGPRKDLELTYLIMDYIEKADGSFSIKPVCIIGGTLKAPNFMGTPLGHIKINVQLDENNNIMRMW